jgi:outer membrane lipoprotein SlyB
MEMKEVQMKARLLAASLAAFLAVSCSTMEPADDMAGARYGKVLSTKVVSGEGYGTQHIVVRMSDGSTVEVVQERDSGILVGDVVRVLGDGKDLRVRRL